MPRGEIEIDEHLQTSVPHIYAAGDCTDQPQFVKQTGTIQRWKLTLRLTESGTEVPSKIEFSRRVLDAGAVLELEPEYQEHYGNPEIWSELQHQLIDSLEGVRP